jgi:hypothetical protein
MIFLSLTFAAEGGGGGGLNIAGSSLTEKTIASMVSFLML